MQRLVFALLSLAFVLGVSRADAKYVPPPIAGHVTDAAGRLAPTEIAALNEKLASYRTCSTNHVAVFFPRSLEGNSVEDVAHSTFNTWKIGDTQRDNGVLLVLATNERRVRIETGKGVGGELTDVDSAHILRDDVNPNLKENRFFAAADQATTSIAKKLGGCNVSNVSPASAPPKADLRDSRADTLVLRLALAAGAALLLFVTTFPWRTLLSSLLIAVLAGVALFGLMTVLGYHDGKTDWVTIIALGSAANGCLFLTTLVSLIIRGSKSGSGSSGSGDSTWSSSSYDASSSSSSSSDGGSSYSGGGGSSGGGGASDSY